MKTRANPPEDPGLDNSDKEPLEIRIEFVDQNNEPDRPEGCFMVALYGITVLGLVGLSWAVHDTYELVRDVNEILA